MKKALVIFAVAAFVMTFASCSKVCSCTEKNTGEHWSEPIKVLGVKVYKNCKDLQKHMNADEPGSDWKCK